MRHKDDLKLANLSQDARSKATSLLKAGTHPENVVQILNDEFEDDLHDNDMLDLTIHDVREWKDHIEALRKAEQDAIIERGIDEESRLAEMHRQVERYTGMLDRANGTADDILDDFQEARKHWDPAKDDEYPWRSIREAKRLISETRNAIKDVYKDEQLRTFIENVQVDTGGGWSSKEVTMTILNMATILREDYGFDVDKGVLMEVFHEASEMSDAELDGTLDAIDVDADVR